MSTWVDDSSGQLLLTNPAQQREEILERLRRLQRDRERVEEQIEFNVADARAAWAEWQQIADALSVSKQAAHKRYRESSPR